MSISNFIARAQSFASSQTILDNQYALESLSGIFTFLGLFIDARMLMSVSLLAHRLAQALQVAFSTVFVHFCMAVGLARQHLATG